MLAIKSRIVGTPMEGLARYAQQLAKIPFRLRNPDMAELFREEYLLSGILPKLLKPDSNIVDVGCHIGGFISEAMRSSPNGQHILIEPTPSKAAWLRKKFPTFVLHQLALSDRSGVADFIENIAEPAKSRLGTIRNDSVHCYKVKTSTLDELITSPVDFIKLDIEGNELLALRGGVKTIASYRPTIIFECGSEASLHSIGASRVELFELVTLDLGYSIFTFSDFVYNKGHLSFDEFRKCGLYPFKAFNFIAIPRAIAPDCA